MANSLSVMVRGEGGDGGVGDVGTVLGSCPVDNDGVVLRRW